MTDFISRDALRVSSLYGYEYVSLAEVRAAPPIRCRTCRWLAPMSQTTDFDGWSGTYRWDQCGRAGCPAHNQQVDPDRFGCVCHEVQP